MAKHVYKLRVTVDIFVSTDMEAEQAINELNTNFKNGIQSTDNVLIFEHNLIENVINFD